MPDGYGRLLRDEVTPQLVDTLYARRCWVCGAELKENEESVCFIKHRMKRPEVSDE